MTISDTYRTFLDRPSQGALAEKAALHYITTLTSIHDAAAIIKHLSVQEKLLKKTKQKVLSVVEGRHALSLDVETTIEFQNGGGAYLPGLDDNFVADRTVTFPMVSMLPCEFWAHTDSKPGPHCAFRQRRQDRADPTVLGPGLAAQAN